MSHKAPHTAGTSPQETSIAHALNGVGQQGTLVLRIDPRSRILATVFFAGVCISLTTLAALLLALAIGLGAVYWARLPLAAMVRKAMAMDTFIIAILIMLPFTTPSAPHVSPLFSLWGLEFSQAGLDLAIQIALKANAVALTTMALISISDSATIGRAMHRLGVPLKFVSLLLFTVRYIDVLRHEYLRLRAAMKCRAFQAGTNTHTYKTFGYLMGMLLVRSFERSDRILDAMRCRGFDGHFYILDDMAYHRRDAAFALVCCVLLSGVIALEIIS
jgi:cobalt/nickel transport system permease protein